MMKERFVYQKKRHLIHQALRRNRFPCRVTMDPKGKMEVLDTLEILELQD